MAHDDATIAVNKRTDGNSAAQGEARPDVVSVPIALIKVGISPRLDGESKAHIARLTETEMPLPPILVDRRTMRVIDGMHRLIAATMKGQDVIKVEYFDGSESDAFLRAVEANVLHGLPLSQADRRAAAIRIIVSHPQMSDRAIAESTGLAAKTIASIRSRSTDAVPQLNARVGRDGKLRPLNGYEGRRRAAEILAENPNSSLRDIAQRAGISLATAHDVRKRIEHGLGPAPGHVAEAGDKTQLVASRKTGPNSTNVLEKLKRDPSIRQSEQGRWLLHWLQGRAIAAQEWPRVVATVPPHCTALVSQLARDYARMWAAFAQELDEHARASTQ